MLRYLSAMMSVFRQISRRHGQTQKYCAQMRSIATIRICDAVDDESNTAQPKYR